MKTNPLSRQDLFHTPATPEELWSWIEQLSGGERVAAITAAGLAWNLAHQIVQKEIDQPG